MDFPRINMHVHSNFSDGNSSLDQIIKKALKLKMEYIAITDHFSNSWKSNIIPTLNSPEKINNYLKILNYYKNQLKKDNNLRLYKGIEIDLGSSETFIKDLIHPEDYDIILIEYLETDEGLLMTGELIQFWKDGFTEDVFPLIGLAHFDPFYFLNNSLEPLIELLKTHSIYFEFNSRYPEFYSYKNKEFFLKLKQEQIPVTVGCDSHDLKRLNDYQEPMNMIQYYSLENNFRSFLEKLNTL